MAKALTLDEQALRARRLALKYAKKTPMRQCSPYGDLTLDTGKLNFALCECALVISRYRSLIPDEPAKEQGS